HGMREIECTDCRVHPATLAERAIEIAVGCEPVGAEVPGGPAVLELAGEDDLAVCLARHVLGALRLVSLVVVEELARVCPALAGKRRVEVARSRRGQREGGERHEEPGGDECRSAQHCWFN